MRFVEGARPFDGLHRLGDPPFEIDSLARNFSQQATQRALLAASRRRNPLIAQAE